jgi:wyosine [tRNA(Phe)-imidazoG37] synthetase (radical SAM superfamily)
MSYVFGPVPSRRLGLSLGVDLIPAKTCTFDCLYCQLGRTLCKTLSRKPYVPVDDVIVEIRRKLLDTVPDVITLSGSGEPTLHSEIDQVIDSIKQMTDIKVVVLTNGSLLWREDVRGRLLTADIIVPTLSSSLDETFQMIHRPHEGLDLASIVDGLKMLRQDYSGQLFLELVFLAGINDTDQEVEGLKTLVGQISPEKIHLNTVVRPPADSRAIALDRERLEDIKEKIGEKAEVVAENPVTGSGRKENSRVSTLLDMIKRRPLRPSDIAVALRLSATEVDELVTGLLIKGYIRKQEHSGDIYYLSNENIHHR